MGGPGAPTIVVVVCNGWESEAPAKTTLTLAPGDVVVVMTAGGGGYGDPKKRPPKAISNDVANGLLTREKAWADHGYRSSGPNRSTRGAGA